MIINSYLKTRKYFLIVLIIAVITIFFTVKPKKIIINKNIFTNYLKEELKKEKLLLTETQNIKFKYRLEYKKIFFIARKNGLKDVFSAEIRTTNKGEIIDLRNIEQITRTPLSDENIIYSDNNIFIYKNNFNRYSIINIIRKQKLTHLITDKKISNIYYKNNLLIMNNKKISLNNLKTNDLFKVYTESLQKKNVKYFNNLNKNLKEDKKNDNYRYVTDSGISRNKELPFNYLKIKIPRKNYFEIYFFNKNSYFLKIIDSGGIKYSKTGYFFKNNIHDKNNIFLDFKIKGGLKDKKYLIRPVLTNYPTILINGKNNIGYGFLKENYSENDTLLQFGYPLIFKGKKMVEIENLKINLSKSSQKEKLRTGICLKNKEIGYFQIFSNRNLLIDYLYLVNCDYAVETGTQNISTEPIKNNRPKMVLIPKNQNNKSSFFKKYKFLEKYEDEQVKIYKIPCGKLNLSYKRGQSDPIVAQRPDTETKGINKDSISLYSGSTDPINPDGLYSNHELYYHGKKEMKAFMITDTECKIGENTQSPKFQTANEINVNFCKQGKIILKENRKYEIKNNKYKKILSAIGIKDDIVFLWQFKKPFDYKKIFEYNKKIKADEIIIFENYNGILDENSGKLIIGNLKNGKEIFPLETD